MTGKVLYPFSFQQHRERMRYSQVTQGHTSLIVQLHKLSDPFLFNNTDRAGCCSQVAQGRTSLIVWLHKFLAGVGLVGPNKAKWDALQVLLLLVRVLLCPPPNDMGGVTNTSSPRQWMKVIQSKTCKECKLYEHFIPILNNSCDSHSPTHSCSLTYSH